MRDEGGDEKIGSRETIAFQRRDSVRNYNALQTGTKLYGARRDRRMSGDIFEERGPRICTNTREHLRMLAHATRTRDQWLADHLSRNTRFLASRGNIETLTPRRLFPPEFV